MQHLLLVKPARHAAQYQPLGIMTETSGFLLLQTLQMVLDLCRSILHSAVKKEAINLVS